MLSSWSFFDAGEKRCSDEIRYMDCVLFTLVCHWGEQYIKAMLSCGVALLLCSQEAQKQEKREIDDVIPKVDAYVNRSTGQNDVWL